MVRGILDHRQMYFILLVPLCRHGSGREYADQWKSPRSRQNHLPDATGELRPLGHSGLSEAETIFEQHWTSSGQGCEYDTWRTRILRADIFRFNYVVFMHCRLCTGVYTGVFVLC